MLCLPYHLIILGAQYLYYKDWLRVTGSIVHEIAIGKRTLRSWMEWKDECVQLQCQPTCSPFFSYSLKGWWLSWQDPAAISVTPFSSLEQHQCINLDFISYADHNYRIPHAGCNGNRRSERSILGIFSISRELPRAKIILRFKSNGWLK